MGWWKWERLPRHPAYKYEYLDGYALLTPRPKAVDAVLDLSAWTGPRPPRRGWLVWPDVVQIRKLVDSDWEALRAPFYSAFAAEEPFKSLSAVRARALADACLTHTRNSGDGDLLPDACFLAESDDDQPRPGIHGAAIITLTRSRDALERLVDAFPAAEGIECVPHLTWIFVRRLDKRKGVGTYLLDRAATELRQLGYKYLASTIPVGNDSSLLWHWKNEFRLLDGGFTNRVTLRPS
jgi:GNAT superfamily N-acetyltransferase